MHPIISSYVLKKSEKKKRKRANKQKGTKCPKVNGESNAYVLYLKLECMNMWKTWLMDSQMWYYDYMDCLKLGGKFKLIKDSDFSPLGQIQSYLDPNPITTLKRPLDMCICALNLCLLLEEKKILESMIRGELSESTLNT